MTNFSTVSSFTSLNSTHNDALYDEYCDYQTLTDDEIGQQAWEEAKMIVDGTVDAVEVFHYRADILWWHLAQMLIPETSAKRFQHLTKVAELVLILPHSNAGEERLFSMVRKNKTDERSRMKLDGTLSNLLRMKLQYPEGTVPCYQWKPDAELLKKSKSSAKEYEEHKK